ncbi:peptidylprolyl isomerase [Candidatus Woesearchaeota archaeon]|nr:peptidylprolyl isomerase [Candidatus Woesearchaeota archaeon]
MKKLIFLALAILVFVNSCSAKEQSNAPEKINEVKMAKYAIIETNKGIIKAELYTEKAPVTTKNFIDLANAGFYDGLTFHRVEPGFVIQGGDPKGDGTGGSGKTIPLEINPDLKHVKGALGMARSQDPNSASSQFYITLAETPFLDGNYAVFGKVIQGMDIVENIRVGDKMNKAYISEK